VLTIPLQYTASNAAYRWRARWRSSSGSGGDPDFEHRHRELAIRESRRWDADRLVERYEGFFHSFRARA
jgi:hypothetical protein